MPIELIWDDEDRSIIHERFIGHWTWEEFHENAVEIRHMAESVSHRVDVIADLEASEGMPIGPAITQARAAMREVPPNWQGIIVVSGSWLVKTLTSVYQSVSRNSFSIVQVDHVDEIPDTIARMRAHESRTSD